MTRKEFIRSSGRASVLAAMTAMTVMFIRNKQFAPSRECINNLDCSRCKKLNACSLPEAKKISKNG